jgi:hypothetical protein
MHVNLSLAPRGALIAGLASALALTSVSPAMAQAAGARARPDSASLITRLGTDTVAVEHFVRTGQRTEAEVVLRVPSVTRTRYLLEMTPQGGVHRLETIALDPRSGAPTGQREVMTREGDSLRIETTAADGQRRTRTVAADAAALPFIDMVHWPFEPVLMRARAMSAPEVPQPLLTGGRASTFRIGRVGADSMTITHPTRGTMRVRVDPDGRLLALDAGATTRKLLVERGRWTPLDAFAARWAAQEAGGRSFGDLSGRGKVDGTVHGARITLDYGTPVKRGREIWGALVPWGQVWRTGANQATHFTTDRELVFGSGSDTLVVPAGTYTLFSIPEREGGVLIVNRQTGQTGTAYDAARDLGRVRMTPRPLGEVVETFTIRADQEGAGGVLRLQWDRTEMVVPFAVRGQ